MRVRHSGGYEEFVRTEILRQWRILGYIFSVGGIGPRVHAREYFPGMSDLTPVGVIGARNT